MKLSIDRFTVVALCITAITGIAINKFEWSHNRKLDDVVTVINDLRARAPSTPSPDIQRHETEDHARVNCRANLPHTKKNKKKRKKSEKKSVAKKIPIVLIMITKHTTCRVSLRQELKLQLSHALARVSTDLRFRRQRCRLRHQVRRVVELTLGLMTCTARGLRFFFTLTYQPISPL